MATKNRMSDDQLQKLCERWQTVLGLADWTVFARYCRQREMQNADSISEVRPRFETKEARVYIIEPVDYFMGDDEPNTFDPALAELALVHELLHLHFLFLTKDMEVASLQYQLLEQSIELLARAITGIVRANNGKS